MRSHTAAAVLACAVALGVGVGSAQPAPDTAVAEPAPNEAILYENALFQGASLTLKAGDEIPDLRNTPEGNWDMRISSLKVGSDAIVVLFSWFKYGNSCLGLVGTASGGSGRYSDLSRIKPKSLDFHLNDRVRSLRVVARGADLSRLCR